ncbi:heparan-alpha-glucosaminide N-acetyltransferase domain-containing protein [Flavobacteriaceae bacterium]|nr:heparan-alpha-glucosaminide N-acetyltransferase domain-containing protein [Flavobacteriaceae bacterium]
MPNTSNASVPLGPTANNTGSHRIAAIDWMRGFVMILMAIDHASMMWNIGRLNGDSAYLPSVDLATALWVPGTLLDQAQFYTRWITHLCAPTFLFLSGTSLAMSFEKRRAEGMPEHELDRHLLIRAAIILACEGFLSLMAGTGYLTLQVLFAISISMVAMIFLRRLSTPALLLLGLGWLVGSEWVLGALFPVVTNFSDGAALNAYSIPTLLLFVAGHSKSIIVLYPMTHWLAMMLIGWAFGRFLLERPANDVGRQQTEKLLLWSGLASLLICTLVRSLHSYGNMGLLRDDTSLVQWLHMSKYPPSLSYSLMELGIMALLLLLCMRRERTMKQAPSHGNPLLVFGQTALFFYMLHFIVLAAGLAVFGGGSMTHGLLETYGAAAVTLILLYPVCIGFRALKRRYPKSFLQYI